MFTVVGEGAIVTNSTIQVSQSLISIGGNGELPPHMADFVKRMNATSATSTPRAPIAPLPPRPRGSVLMSSPAFSSSPPSGASQKPQDEKPDTILDSMPSSAPASSSQSDSIPSSYQSDSIPSSSQSDSTFDDIFNPNKNLHLPTSLVGLDQATYGEKDEHGRTQITIPEQVGISVGRDKKIQQNIRFDPKTSVMCGVPAGATVSNVNIGRFNQTMFDFS